MVNTNAGSGGGGCARDVEEGSVRSSSETSRCERQQGREKRARRPRGYKNRILAGAPRL